MTSKPSKVLVLGSDARSFLSIVRSLGRAGLEVHSAWTEKSSIARSSRFLYQTHEIATPWDGGIGWIRNLNDLHSANDFAWVVPCNDQSAIPIRASRDSLIQSQTYYLLNDQAFDVVNSKIESVALAGLLGIPIPRSATISDAGQLDEIADELGFPLVLKPESSFTSASLSRKRKVVTIGSQVELNSAFQRMSTSEAPLQVQKYFQGVGTGIEFLADQGKLLRVFQHLRLHEPPGGGGSSYRKSIPLHHKMLEATEKLVGHTKYSGVGMAEFLWNRPTDQWRFVEINGRFWGSLPLAIASKADFPANLHSNRLSGQTVFRSDYRIGVHCRNLHADKNWVTDFLRSKNTSIGMKFLKLLSGGCGAAIRVLVGKEYVDTFTWDDPKPFFAEVISLWKDIYSGILRKLRSRLRQTLIHRRRRRRQLLGRLASVTSMLFVCKGNICRSPFAERYSSSRLPERVRVASAGYYPESNRPAPENASLASQQLGVSLRSHRSNQLSSQHVSESDLVIVFDEENLDRIQTEFHEHSDKTFLLHHICESGSLAVKDPYGSSEEKFVATYREIMLLVDALVEQLEA